MRNTLIYIFLLCIGVTLAQSPSFDLNKMSWYLLGSEWEADEFKVSSQEHFQTSSYIGKIDSTTNVYYKLNSTLPFKLDGKEQKQFFVRIDSLSGNLYLRSFQNESKEYLLYDFNLKVGDEIKTVLTANLKNTLVVTAVKTEQFEGAQRKVIEAKVKVSANSRTYKFIEGIGTSNGFLVNLTTETSSVSVLKCAHNGNDLVFSSGSDCPSTPKLKPRPSKKN